MNKRTLWTALAVAALLLAAGAPPALAQAKGAFSIDCDVTGARVYLNGELAGYTKPTFSALLSPGQYSVRVSAPGYRDYTTTIQMTARALNLQVRLRSAPQPPTGRHTVVITCNVPRAQVYINGELLGVAPVRVALQAGSYSLRVSAPGHADLNEVIAVRGDMTYSAVLQGSDHRLSVTANVVGARVYVDGALVGSTPFEGRFAPGTYEVRLAAPGFQDAATTITLVRDESIAFVLQQGLASVEVRVDPLFLDPRDRNALAQIKVYIDGRYEHGFSFQLPAGRHDIRITSGGLSVEGTFELVAGRSYTIEPSLSLMIR